MKDTAKAKRWSEARQKGEIGVKSGSERIKLLILLILLIDKHQYKSFNIHVELLLVKRR